ncbi:MAG TPA: hypothetical protein DCZ00_04110 [Lactococcus sp.]|uniref:hypothetical protein n=1 Tax=unclassified Lactococcus TaxID=2643510 RepID=UPI000E9CAFB0|nr:MULTISPECIES: hypothetical protein [unclassified Lactococcus]HAP15636.1 hypothetical protein [Lactococcus sp.]HBC90612.1 hypothetical protein [Lactococcus sp.]
MEKQYQNLEQIIQGFVRFYGKKGVSFDTVLETANIFAKKRKILGFDVDLKNKSIILHYECMKKDEPYYTTAEIIGVSSKAPRIISEGNEEL